MHSQLAQYEALVVRWLLILACLLVAASYLFRGTVTNLTYEHAASPLPDTVVSASQTE